MAAERFEPGVLVGEYQVLGHWTEHALEQRIVAQPAESAGRRRARKAPLFALRDLGPWNDLVYTRLLSLSERVLQIAEERILPIYDIIPHDGRLVVASPFVAGESLAKVGRSADGPLDPRVVLCVGIELAGLLQRAEAALQGGRRAEPLPHGNLDPSRVMLAHDTGALHVGDWALHEALRGANRSGASADDPYAAPERRLGLDAGPSIPSDIYAIGEMLRHLLVGGKTSHAGRLVVRSLARGGMRQGGKRHDGRSTLDVALNDVLRRATATDPEERFASAEVLLEALNRLRLRHCPRLDVDEELLHLVRQHGARRGAALSGLIARWQADAPRSRRQATADLASPGPRCGVTEALADVPTVDLRPQSSAARGSDRAHDPSSQPRARRLEPVPRPNSSTSPAFTFEPVGPRVDRNAETVDLRPQPFSEPEHLGAPNVETRARAPELREAAFAAPSFAAPNLARSAHLKTKSAQAPFGPFAPRTDDLANTITRDLTQPRPHLRAFLVVLLIFFGIAAATLWVHLAMPEGEATLEEWLRILRRSLG